MQPNDRILSKKEAKKHDEVLQRHVKDFFALLDRKPKPSDEEVRNEFIRHESEWRVYCIRFGLGTHTSQCFNANVSRAWTTKYAKKSPK